jgi:hypothetical protein
MSVSLDSQLKKQMQEPTGERIQLVVGVHDGPGVVAESIRDVPTASATDIGMNTLRVQINDRQLDRLLSVGGIERIEADRKGSPLRKGK